jgi:hypothetical protein
MQCTTARNDVQPGLARLRKPYAVLPAPGGVEMSTLGAS